MVRADVDALVTQLQPGVLRFPGGSRAMLYHFDETIGPYAADRKPQCDTFTGETDATTWGMDEGLRYAEQHGAEVTLVTPWGDGTPERAAAMVAYANATTSSAIEMEPMRTAGTGEPRGMGRAACANGHPAPYGVRSSRSGTSSTSACGQGLVCGTDRPFTQAERFRERRVHPFDGARCRAAGLEDRTAVKQVDPRSSSARRL